MLLNELKDRGYEDEDEEEARHLPSGPAHLTLPDLLQVHLSAQEVGLAQRFLCLKQLEIPKRAHVPTGTTSQVFELANSWRSLIAT